MSKLKWFIGIPVALLVLASAGIWVYINVIKEDPPEALDFAETDPEGTPAPGADGADPADGGTGDSGSIEGEWVVGAGSTAGYRVPEVLLGQDTEGVGRTEDVTGSLTVEGTTVSAASFTVDLTTVTSDESRRDGQFHGRIMATDEFPVADFTLTEPVDLPDIPTDGSEFTVTVTGDLTLRGTTQPVTTELRAKSDGSGFQVVVSIEIVFEDWGIPNPSNAAVTTGEEGTLEALLVLQRA